MKYTLVLTHGHLDAGMDPPRDMTVLYVTEESVTISWIQPLAPFDYYKMSYQSPKGNSSTVYLNHVEQIRQIIKHYCL